MSDETLEAGFEQVPVQTSIEEGKVLKDSFNYRFGSDLDEAVELYGADVVFQLYRRQGRVDVQQIARARMVGGIQGTDLQESMDGYTLGAGSRGMKVDPLKAALAKYSRMSPEEQAAFRESLSRVT